MTMNRNAVEFLIKPDVPAFDTHAARRAGWLDEVRPSDRGRTDDRLQ